MPEPPDFDQIADTIATRVESHISDLDPERETDDDAVRATVIRQIAEQLRHVWNARGAADLEEMGPIIAKLADAMDPDHAREFVVDTIRKLDR